MPGKTRPRPSVITTGEVWPWRRESRRSRKPAGAATITVWVPDYFCDEALAPLRGLGVHLRFDRFRQTLAPIGSAWRIWQTEPIIRRSWSWCTTSAFPMRCGKQKNFVTGGVLFSWEDGAHVLAPCSGMGLGTLQIYSPRKVLAVLLVAFWCCLRAWRFFWRMSPGRHREETP